MSKDREDLEAVGNAACQLLRYMYAGHLAEVVERATNSANARNLREYAAKLAVELKKAGFKP